MRFTLSLFLLLMSTTLFSQSTPPLWEKAVDIMSDNLNWVPGEMIMQFELLDKKGNADMINVSKYKIYLDENGKVKSELVSMFNDGQDVTEQEKEKLEKEEEKNDENSEEHNAEFSLAESPFHPDNQDKITVLPNPFTPNDDGFNDYVKFKFPEMYIKQPVIQIFNLRGRKVNQLENFSGHEYRWYGKDNNGKHLEPGVYIYIIDIEGEKISNGTITLIR